MKASPILRLATVFLMAGLLWAGAPPLQATVVRNNNDFWQTLKEKEKQKEKKEEQNKKRTQVPEGNGRVLLVLAAGALGGSVLVWRRQRRANIT